MNIREALRKAGIDRKKADVYLACLETGKATAYAIAKRTGLRRPTVYDIADRLMKEGLVFKSVAKGTRFYSPADPEALLERVRRQERDIKSVMPELQELYNGPKIKPAIRYFEGKDGITEMYEDSLRSLKKGDEILGYVGEGIIRHLPNYTEDYIKRRVEKGIVFRGIYKSNEDLDTYMEHNQEQLRIGVVLPEATFPLGNEINIYGNKVAVANYGTEMFGMLIESKEFSDSQRAIFALAWKGASITK
ncbi:MAG: helix-turn-helix domain-containing protein [Candidatus Moraniibacteriota bacterium]